MRLHRSAPLALLLFNAPAMAQLPAFRTPGMPRVNTGQTDQFSNEFNPSFGLVLEALGTYTDTSGGSEGDGLDLTLRTLEGTVNAYVDPRIWAWGVVVVHNEEEFELEEAAAQWIGWENNATLRAGRFYVDFGKQMQAHVHDTQFVDRPLVLRTFLGEELGGTGVQFDNWFAVGEETVVRYSLALFETLVPGHETEPGSVSGAQAVATERPEFEELSFSARLTGFTDVGQAGVFQLGMSARHIGAFDLELDSSGALAPGLENTVMGVDATYGWSNEAATKRWDMGSEVLLIDGDLGGRVLDGGTPADASDDSIAVFDDSALGYYAWTEYGWNQSNSAGVLVSQTELLESGLPDVTEVELFYTHNFTEFSRLRFAFRVSDAQDGPDTSALLVQFTNILGPHAHGLNW